MGPGAAGGGRSGRERWGAGELMLVLERLKKMGRWRI